MKVNLILYYSENNQTPIREDKAKEKGFCTERHKTLNEWIIVNLILYK